MVEFHSSLGQKFRVLQIVKREWMILVQKNTRFVTKQLTKSARAKKRPMRFKQEPLRHLRPQFAS